MIKLTCTSCRKPLSIDETKLPMKEVAFPCPVCKTKLTVDRRNFAPEGAVAVAGTPPVEGDDEEGELHEKALIAGNDSPAIRQAAKSIGYQPLHFPTMEAARDFYLREYPPVVFFTPAQLTAPPLAEAAPLTSVSPADRRKGFYILVADNLRTMDGNAAFLYGVNLVVATKDLGSINKIFREAELSHQRLYKAFSGLATE